MILYQNNYYCRHFDRPTLSGKSNSKPQRRFVLEEHEKKDREVKKVSWRHDSDDARKFAFIIIKAEE